MSFRSPAPLSLLFLLAACVSNPTAVRAQERPGQPVPPVTEGGPPSIHVQGTGEVQAMPDEAHVDLAVETQAATAKAAAEQNAQRMEKVVAALVEAGVARDVIQTQQYQLFPVYTEEREGRREPRVTGYRAQNTVTMRLRQLGQIGQLIDRAIAAGANRVESVRFGLSNPQEAQGRALREAVERARQSAQVLAESLGVQLGPVLEASTATESPPWVPMPMMARSMKMEDAATTPITPQEQTVQATVTVRYAIGKAR